MNKETSELKSKFGIFTVIDENTVEMDGVINSSTLNDFNELIDSYPDVDLIEIIEVPGSDDDEVNLQVAQLIYSLEIDTHLLDDGLIASGGVDFFLAGEVRTKGRNTKIGVHSWNDGERDATDFPRGHANHKPYIDYYKSIGFSQAESEAFYYFTINAATSESIHYMTEKEIKQYHILQN